MEGQISLPENHIRILQGFIGLPVAFGLLLGIVMYAVRRRDFFHFLKRGQVWSFAVVGMLWLLLTASFCVEMLFGV